MKGGGRIGRKKYEKSNFPNCSKNSFIWWICWKIRFIRRANVFENEAWLIDKYFSTMLSSMRCSVVITDFHSLHDVSTIQDDVNASIFFLNVLFSKAGAFDCLPILVWRSTLVFLAHLMKKFHYRATNSTTHMSDAKSSQNLSLSNWRFDAFDKRRMFGG